jgi:hypothetical protein
VLADRIKCALRPACSLFVGSFEACPIIAKVP